MLASADPYFGVESGAFDSYLLNEETLAAITTPIKLLVSAQSHPFFAEAAGRLAERLGVEVRDARDAFSVSRPSRGTGAENQTVPSAYQWVSSSSGVSRQP
jgi:hypothetical protein